MNPKIKQIFKPLLILGILGIVGFIGFYLLVTLGACAGSIKDGLPINFGDPSSSTWSACYKVIFIENPLSLFIDSSEIVNCYTAPDGVVTCDQSLPEYETWRSLPEYKPWR